MELSKENEEWLNNVIEGFRIMAKKNILDEKNDLFFWKYLKVEHHGDFVCGKYYTMLTEAVTNKESFSDDEKKETIMIIINALLDMRKKDNW